MEKKKQLFVLPSIEVIELKDDDLIITASDGFIDEYSIGPTSFVSED